MSDKDGNSMLPLFVGAPIGIGVGLFLTSKKGSKVKRKIKKGFDDLKDQAKTKWDSLDDETKERFAETKDNLKGKVESFLSDSSYKAEEAISFLEEKLAELKQQNAKLQK